MILDVPRRPNSILFLVRGDDCLFLGFQVVCRHEFGGICNSFGCFGLTFGILCVAHSVHKVLFQLFPDCLLPLTARGHLINILPWSQRKLFPCSFLGHGSLLASEEFLGRQLAFAQASIRETCLQGSSQFGFAPYLCFPLQEI